MNDDYRLDYRKRNQKVNPPIVFGVCGLIGILVDFFDVIALVFIRARSDYQSLSGVDIRLLGIRKSLIGQFFN